MSPTSAPAIQISRKGMFIWIGLIIFVSFWMFVLGVMVGRGMSPVNLEAGKLEKELNALKAKMLQQEQDKLALQAEGKSGEKPQLGFYEALKDPGRQTDFKPAKPVQPPAPKPLPAPSARVPKPEPKASSPPVPAPKPKIEPAPTPKPKSDPASAQNKTLPAESRDGAAGYFAVQVAAVQDVEGAGRIVSELRSKGYQAYQIRSEVAGKGVWYRIRVGGFEDRAAAERVLQRLKGDKYGGMVVSTK